MTTVGSYSKELVFMMKYCKESACLLVIIFLRYLLLFARASDAEGNALYAVRQALDDPNGILSSWSIDLVDPCSNWNLVSCDDQKHVISVSLAGQGFTGVLSPQIGNLRNLQTLELQNNNLSSTLPDELGNLTNLLSLDAHSNFFTGPIPTSLGHLSKLRYLILSNNNLNGTIPTAITEISSLSDLNLSYNNLTGTIPEAVFNIPEYNVLGNHVTCPRTRNSVISCSLFKNATTSLKQVSASKRSNLGALVGGTIGSVLVLVALATVLLKSREHYYRQKRDVFVDVAAEDDLKIIFGQLKRFSWRELQVATECFHEKNVLGQGGFGKVFKGVLVDGTQVAVKRLKDNHIPGGEAAFLREVEMIGVAVHRNLLNLIGFCATSSERLLVYPFMANRSVAYQLRERKYGEAVLDWSHRKQIALGAARGLAYLHDHCNPRIIHRDVKAANVLLDEDFHPVVGDFGLAKLVDSSHTHVTTVVRGTMGHIAPEYLSTGKSSEKTDVFGYGILLLELVTGQRAIDFSRLQEQDDILLLDHVKKLQHEKRLVSIIDPSMLQYNVQEVEELIQVALICTQPAPEDRPTMPEVVRMLSGEGLGERWEEWQQVEGLRRREYEMMPQRLMDWMEDSTINLEAIELSTGR